MLILQNYNYKWANRGTYRLKDRGESNTFGQKISAKFLENALNPHNYLI